MWEGNFHRGGSIMNECNELGHISNDMRPAVVPESNCLSSIILTKLPDEGGYTHNVNGMLVPPFLIPATIC